MELTREQMKECVQLWHRNGEFLERVREDDIRNANTQQSILMFEQAFRVALRDQPPRSTSGLVEWQRYMELWRRRG
jgi:hypothetical protein